MKWYLIDEDVRDAELRVLRVATEFDKDHGTVRTGARTVSLCEAVRSYTTTKEFAERAAEPCKDCEESLKQRQVVCAKHFVDYPG